MFETKKKKSGNKASSGEIGLNIRTLASPKVRGDQVSGGVSVLCWHATWLQMPYGILYSAMSYSVNMQVMERGMGMLYDCIWSSCRMSCTIREKHYLKNI